MCMFRLKATLFRVVDAQRYPTGYKVPKLQKFDGPKGKTSKVEAMLKKEKKKPPHHLLI